MAQHQQRIAAVASQQQLHFRH